MTSTNQTASRPGETNRRLRRRLSVAWICAVAILMTITTISPASAADPDIKVTPNQIKFGKIDGTKTKRLTIQNKGKAELKVSSLELCPQSSTEFSFVPFSATVAAKKKVSIDLSYTPADAGADSGCLTVFSNDPDTPQVRVTLSGSARSANPGAVPLQLRPSSLGFGEVGVGSSSTLGFQVKTHGRTLQGVNVNRCFETSDEFVFAPTAPFEVSPGNSPRVSVTYTPLDIGDDTGCLEVRSGDPDDPVAILNVSGSGVEAISGVDLDIHDFKVTNRARVDLGRRIKVQLFVRNPGTVDEPRTARVVGEQNGETVYDEELAIRHRVGNQGVSKYTFPSFTPLELGDILWTATIDDDDPDLDQRMAVTSASAKPTDSTGVDLDIRRFSVTKNVVLDERNVGIRLKVMNNGTEDAPRDATVVGMQDAVEVYAETLPVADSVGNSGSTVFRLPSYTPVAAGDILWMVVIEDDDPDVDEALAVTHVSER